jgi:hypothetical protein
MPELPSLLQASGFYFLKRERQRYLLSFDRRLEMPSVSSARRSAVGSVDMRAENKSQLGHASKDKEELLYSCAKMKRSVGGTERTEVSKDHRKKNGGRKMKIFNHELRE